MILGTDVILGTTKFVFDYPSEAKRREFSMRFFI